jgi:hypothetical protein
VRWIAERPLDEVDPARRACDEHRVSREELAAKAGSVD